MPDILDVIVSRKSIRRYKPDPVPDEMLDKVLEAARWAPTGENYQPWRFIVVRDQATRNRIADLARLGSGSRMTAWYCMGHMQERFAGIEDPEKRAKVLRFMYSGEVSAFAKDAPVVIAVDGTAACGKGTLARLLARHYGFAHLDSGALYRLVALGVIEANGDPTSEADAVNAARDMAAIGVPADGLTIDWPALMRFKRSVVDPTPQRTLRKRG